MAQAVDEVIVHASAGIDRHAAGYAVHMRMLGVDAAVDDRDANAPSGSRADESASRIRAGHRDHAGLDAGRAFSGSV
jgi:hypothetical protein